MAKLTKFPVTAPDGAEYRVTITEDYDGLFGHSYEMNVYVERPNARWFRFKKVHNVSYRNNDFQKASGDDLIEFAQLAVNEYLRKRKKARDTEEGFRTAVDRFRKWDGKITNNPEVSE